MNDSVGVAKIYYNISLVYHSKYKEVKFEDDKNKFIENLKMSKDVLEKFEKETGYHHPFLEDIIKKSNELKNNKKDLKINESPAYVNSYNEDNKDKNYKDNINSENK